MAEALDQHDIIAGMRTADSADWVRYPGKVAGRDDTPPPSVVRG